MSNVARFCLLALACGAGVTWGGNQKVYRCGQTYQQVPCATDTTGQAVDAQDPRNAEQRKAARASAAADKRQAKTLATERVQREKAIQPQQAPLVIGQKPAEPAASAPTPGADKPHSKKRKNKAPEPDRYVAPPPIDKR
jgi:hypothetical protein